MKRRSFVCLTALLCLVVLLLPLSVSAATVAEGTCGENVNWVLDDNGTMTISGTGDMTNFEGEFMPWKQAKTVKKLVVEEGVTSIGDRAFEFFSNLKKVDLADSITYIGESAFSNNAIEEITLPKNLKTIRSRAFCATPIKSIKLPSKLEKIGFMAFTGTDLKTITIPASVKELEVDEYSPFSSMELLESIEVSSKNKYYCDVDGVLFNKDKTVLIQYPQGRTDTSYTIPDSVDVISDMAFWHAKFSSVTIPKGVKEIQSDAFFYVKNLKEVTLPSTVKSIASDAFANCDKLQKIDVSGSNKYFCDIDGVLFSKDKKALLLYPAGKLGDTYEIPAGTETIGSYAFSGVKKVHTIFAPKSVKTVEYGCVRYCSKLTYIIFKGDAPTSDSSEYAFYDDVTILYPVGNKTWTKKVINNFTWDGDFESVSVTPYNPKLDAPVITAKTSASSGCVKVSWEKVDGATQYYICRANDEGDFWCIGITDKTSFTIKGVEPGTEITCMVFAGDGTQGPDGAFTRSLESNYASAMTKLPRVKVTAKNTASSGKIKLSWDKVDGAKSYTVYRASSKTGTYKKLDTVTKTSYTDSSATVGKKYYYKVVAVHKNSDANSAKSEAVARTRDLAQVKVKAENIASSGKIKLSWKSVSNATGYKVYRATSKNGTYKSLKTVTATTYTDSSAKAGKKYYYKVVAIHSNSSANSAKSESVARTCDLARPALAVKLNSKGDPKISWEAVSGAEQYEVYRRTGTGGGAE